MGNRNSLYCFGILLDNPTISVPKAEGLLWKRGYWKRESVVRLCLQGMSEAVVIMSY